MKRLRNRTFRLMYQSAFFGIAVVAFLASLGLFDAKFNREWFIYYTNLSNYLCMAVMFMELRETAVGGEGKYNTFSPIVKFCGCVAITLTFLVFNFILAGAPDRDPALNFRVNSVLLHIVIPVMYMTDWFLFYERGKAKFVYAALPILMTIVYAVFIFVRAPFVGEGGKKYPYFFLNLDNLGVSGVAVWIGIITGIIFAISLIYIFMDRFLGRKTKN